MLMRQAASTKGFTLPPLIMMTAGFAWVLASLGVFLRDLRQLVSVLVPALMFISPVFFPMAMVPPGFGTLIMANPLSVPIEMMRQAIFKTRHAHLAQRGCHPLAHFGFRVAHVQRPKGHIVEHGGGKELVIGVLEHHADLAANQRQVFFGNAQAGNGQRALTGQQADGQAHSMLNRVGNRHRAVLADRRIGQGLGDLSQGVVRCHRKDEAHYTKSFA